MSRLAALAVAALVALGLGFAGRGMMLGGGHSEDVRPAIGGPFTLTAHDGRTVTDADFRGRYMLLYLLYFGYTYCPDICPMGLDAMTRALDALPPATAARIKPILITVDPERDTPERLAEYVALFHPDMIGLTGTPEQIRQAARAYRVFYARADGTDLYDHSSVVYLMGPDGAYVASFNHATPPERIAASLAEQVR